MNCCGWLGNTDAFRIFARDSAYVLEGVSDQVQIEQMAIIGHIPREVGLDDALSKGLVMVAHLNDFWCRTFDCGANENLLGAAVNPMVRHGAWVATTLSLNRNIMEMYCGDVEALEQYYLREYWRFVHPSIVGQWLNLVNGSWNPPGCSRNDAVEGWEFLKWYSETELKRRLELVANSYYGLPEPRSSSGRVRP